MRGRASVPNFQLMKNKYAKIILTLLLLCGLQQQAVAQCLRDEVVYQDVLYRVDKPGTLAPKACVLRPVSAVKGRLAIPQTIIIDRRIYQVNGIQTSAFSGQTEMTSVSLPRLDYWGTDVFADCTALTEVNIPAAMTEVGHWMFRNCKSLKRIVLPEGLLTIGDEAFEGSGLAEVTLPAGVVSVGERAFAGTPWYESQPDGVVTSGPWALGYKGNTAALDGVSFASGVTHIADGFFRNMERLTVLALPEGISTLGQKAAQGLPSLTEVTLPASLERVGDEAFSECEKLERVTMSGKLRTLGMRAFSYCPQLSAVTLPASLDSIGRECFRYGALTEVALPSSLRRIGACAFADNPLRKVVSAAATPPVLDYDDFDELYAFDQATLENAELLVPQGAAAAYRTAEGWKGFAAIGESDRVSGIEEAADGTVSIGTAGGRIYAAGTKAGTPLEIFAADGTQVYSGTERSVRVMPRQLYVVRVGAQCAKVFVP